MHRIFLSQSLALGIIKTLLVIALVSFARAQAVNQPSIQFATTQHDTGRILSGAIVQHDFIFTNIGKANLSVTNVLSSCGCITSTNWSREIPPGEQGRIPLSFNSTGMLGEFLRTLTISTNDPAQPSITLTIKGSVWQKIQLSPPTAMIYLSQDSATTATIIITNHTEQPLNLQAPLCNLPQFSTRLETTKPGQEFKLIVEAKAPFPQSALRGLIMIGTTSKEVPVINIPLTTIQSANKPSAATAPPAH